MTSALQANKRYVVYPGEETYPLAHDTEAINLNHFLKKLNTLAPNF